MSGDVKAKEERLILKNPHAFDEVEGILEEYHEKSDPAAAGQFKIMALRAKTMSLINTVMDDEFIANVARFCQNSRLGFLTDRPDVGNGLAKDGKPAGYPPHVLRTCLMEAAIAGLLINGNEFNIIGGNMYTAINGFRGLFRRDTRFSDLKIDLGTPSYENSGATDRYGEPIVRAIVKASATWSFRGKPDSMTGVVIPIRVNKGMGDDAILGKAERKLLSRVYNQVVGMNLYDGDANDADSAQAPAIAATEAASPQVVKKRIRKAEAGEVGVEPPKPSDSVNAEGGDNANGQEPEAGGEPTPDPESIRNSIIEQVEAMGVSMEAFEEELRRRKLLMAGSKFQFLPMSTVSLIAPRVVEIVAAIVSSHPNA